ncbi:unnamed protein product [Notodromas monacha]|uniref:EF-hand domain-containing protein n=1 Tax=Notodromas monacha TaxID=399045 RepID=A0A7R9BRL5_9CRUS|nr:unnamed protein product [Notodromas monacha]CAG0920419.1 unnamed protein product [Notodromas monacha]
MMEDELKLAMDLIGEHMTDAQLDHMLELADIDKDGRINYQVTSIRATLLKQKEGCESDWKNGVRNGPQRKNDSGENAAIRK